MNLKGNNYLTEYIYIFIGYNNALLCIQEDLQESNTSDCHLSFYSKPRVTFRVKV